MEGTLNKILGNHKEITKGTKDTNKLLTKLISIETAELKVQQELLKQQKRDAQAAKRKGADRSPAAAIKEAVKETTKKKDGLLGNILKSLGNIFKGIPWGKLLGLSTAGTVLREGIKNIFGKGGLLNTLINQVFGKEGLLRKSITSLFGKDGVFSKLGNKLFGKDGKFSKLGEKLFGKESFLKRNLNKLFGPKSKLAKSVGGLKTRISKLFGKGGGFAKLSAAFAGVFSLVEGLMGGEKVSKAAAGASGAAGGAFAGAKGGGALGAVLGPKGAAVGAVLGGILGAIVGEQMADAIFDGIKNSPGFKQIFEFVDNFASGFFGQFQKVLGEFKETFDLLGKAFDKFNNEVVGPMFDEVGKFFKSFGAWVTGTWDSFTNEIEYFTKELKKLFDPMVKPIKEVFKYVDKITKPLQDLAMKVIDPLVAGLTALGDAIGGLFGKLFGGGNIAAGGKAAGETLADTILSPFTAINNLVQGGLKSYLGMQTGGFVGRVPNQGGNGDRFRTLVEPGSVVLNQTAAGYQQGGKVPVMLEQGEHVFGPRDPAAGMALMMNSMIPRFQTGGVVKTEGSADTGPGYQPNGEKDKQGRPLVFSKPAAEAWVRMGNNVRGSDVNSAKRSVSKNNAVGGAANSPHLYGEGVDVQTGSKSWHFMKNTDGNYGWKFNNYLGPQGWHWDFKGPGAGVDPGDEDGIAKSQQKTPGFLGMFASATDGKNPSGQGARELLSGIMSGLGSALGGQAGEQAKALTGAILDQLGPLGKMFGSLNLGSSGGGGSGEHNTVEGAASGDMVAGARLIMQAGVPKKGAAYLAGNIQQESSWNGQRDWGQVMGDGTSRNGGLVSWASWSDDPARLGKIEKHLGKNIANASDGEQIGAMLWEMQRDYPKAYSTFMNPNASNADLISASKAYWGYGHEGPRYQYAEQTYSQLQRGGMAYASGGTSVATKHMLQKSQENFAHMIANAASPVVVPVPTGGEPQMVPQDSGGTPFPNLPAEDHSIVSMEYKYRITMGASV